MSLLKRASDSGGAKKSVRVDLRESLGVLKAAIGKELGLPVGEFKLRRTAGGVELKDLNAPVASHGLEDGSSVNVKEGEPLLPHQWQFNVKFVPSQDAAAVALGPFVLEDTMSTMDVKHALFQAFGPSHGTPQPEKTRLRMASGTGTPGGVKMTQVLTDGGATLGGLYGDKLSDGKMLAIQPAPAGEVFTAEHMLVSVRAWSPVTQVLSPPQEIGVLRASSFSEFQAQLAPLLALGSGGGDAADQGEGSVATDEGDKAAADPADTPPPAALAAAGAAAAVVEAGDVVVAKPFAYLLKDVANMAALKWLTLKPEQKIVDAPMRVKDGDVLVFKNRHEKEQVSSAPAGEQEAATHRAHASDGPAFTIFTPSQQVEREESKRAEDKAREEEEKERAEAIRTRIEAAAVKAAFE